jgi:hypothetical protein
MLRQSRTSDPVVVIDQSWPKAEWPLVVGEVEQRTRLETMQQPDCRLCEAAKWANNAADPRAAQQHDLRDRGFGNDRPGFGLDLADCARGDR